MAPEPAAQGAMMATRANVAQRALRKTSRSRVRRDRLLPSPACRPRRLAEPPRRVNRVHQNFQERFMRIFNFSAGP
ncbi:MAG TPA: hypothetical protein VFR86_25125, partial [Burkholderiaceae bacterium]|nr:hypothetical protein [Burkholderiaceae bacterium]